jgi:predicted RNase H-like HicB family nuclease
LKLTKPRELRSFAAYPQCSADLAVDGEASTAYSEVEDSGMRSFNFVVERDPDTGLFVGHVPGWPGAHSQGESLDELQRNLQEVVSMLLEDGEPKLESEFVGVQTIKVA